MEKEKVKKVEAEDVVILGKSERRIIKILSLVAAFLASGLAILMFVFTVIASLSSANLPVSKLADNNIVITLVSRLNNYSVNESKILINTMQSRAGFIIFEIIIPAVAFIGAMILLIFLAKRIIDFTSNIKTEKELYTKGKIGEVRDIITIISIILLTTLVLFNEPSIIFYVLIELLLCMIYVLFKRCVLLKK